MLLRALGPVLVERDGGEVVDLPGRRCRALLAALLLHPDRVVSVDELVELTWPDEPPRTAAKTLQTYVSQLRDALGADRVVTDSGGYRVHAAADEVDVLVFDDLVTAGQARALAGDPLEAERLLVRALALWRGRPFSDVTGADATVARLEERRLVAIGDLARVRLDLDKADVVVADLEGVLVEYPLREDIWCLLVHALHRSGRSADALAAVDRARRVLADELGADPGPELQDLQQRLLEGAPTLTSRPPTSVRYADSGGRLCAYQVLGSRHPGQCDVLLVPDWINHLGLLWQHPAPAGLLRALSALGRLVLFDPVGVGMSDPPRGEVPSLDGVADDAIAVLDAAQARRVVVFGNSIGAAVAVLLAARYPERIEALILHNPLSRTSDTALAVIGYDEAVRVFTEKWATGVAIPSVSPSRVNDAEFNAWFGRFMGASASRQRVPELLAGLVFGVDVLAEAAKLTCPVLVTHRRSNRIIPVAAVAPLAAALQQARIVELPGEDHLWFLDDDGDLLATVAEFLGGPPRQPGSS